MPEHYFKVVIFYWIEIIKKLYLWQKKWQDNIFFTTLKEVCVGPLFNPYVGKNNTNISGDVQILLMNLLSQQSNSENI